MVENSALRTQNRYCMPYSKNVTYEEAYPLLQRTQQLMRRQAPPGFIVRENPNLNGDGIVDIDNICVQAVLKTMMHGTGWRETERLAWTPLFYFLNPPELGLDRTPFPKRLPLIAKIMREFEREFGGGHGHTSYMGNIFDPTSGMIINYETEPIYWIGRKRSGFEFLFDTEKPDTKFALFDLNFKTFQEIAEQHKKRNLFLDGPLEFTHPIGWDWHIPVLGVTEIVGYDTSKKVTLSESGIKEEPFKHELFREAFLLPEKYWGQIRGI